MTLSRYKTHPWRRYIEGTAAVVLECTALYLYFSAPNALQAVSSMLYAVMHALSACLALSAIAGDMSSRPEHRRRWLLLLSIIMLLPLVGLLLVLAFPPEFRQDASTETKDRYSVGTQSPVLSPASPEKLAAEDYHTILETMSLPAPERRCNAVLAMRHLPANIVAPILRRNLQDSDEQVRLFSQHALSRMIESNDRRIADAAKAAEVPEATPADVIQAAQCYHEPVYLGLIGDSETARQYLKNSVEQLKKGLARWPEHKMILLLLLKYSVELGDIEQAESYLVLLQQNHCSAALLAPWELEIRYRQRRWEDFAKVLCDHGEMLKENGSLRAVWTFWTQPSSTAS